MGRFISAELFHFVGRDHPNDHEANYETLKKILTMGCVSHHPHERGWGAMSVTVDWSKRLINGDLVVPSVTCYCDIPFEHLGLHLRKYGHFGLSFERKLLVRCGARPVIYVPLRADDHLSIFGSVLLRDIEAVYRGFRTQIHTPLNVSSGRSRSLGVEPASPIDAAAALDSVLTKDFLAFVKPYDSELPDNHMNYFYSEREWRKYGNLVFQMSDLGKVVVGANYIDRLANDMPKLRGIIHTAPLASTDN